MADECRLTIVRRFLAIHTRQLTTQCKTLHYIKVHRELSKVNRGTKTKATMKKKSISKHKGEEVEQETQARVTKIDMLPL